MPLDPNIPLQTGGRRSNLSQDLVTGMQLKGAQQQMRMQEQQLAQAEKAQKLEKMAGFAQGVLSASPEQRAQVYDSMLPQMAELGLDTSRLPTQYTPEVESSLVNLRDQAIPLLERIKMGREDEQQAYARQRDAKQDARQAPATRERFTDDGMVIQEEFVPGVGFREYGRGPRNTSPESLVEVADPNSPTGTRMLPRSQAAGMPGKPASGMSFEVNSDGTVRVTQGRGAGGVTNSTQGAMEKEMVNQGEILTQLATIKSQFRPEFQTVKTRVKMALASGKDKLDPASLNPEERTQLEAFTQYRANAGRLMSSVLNDLFGAAISAQEMKRGESFLVNTGTGLFDGDGPTEIASKIQEMETFTKKALAKRSYIMRNGLTVDDVDMNDMPRIMNARALEIEAELARQDMKGDDLKNAVKLRLADEFGLVAY